MICIDRFFCSLPSEGGGGEPLCVLTLGRVQKQSIQMNSCKFGVKIFLLTVQKYLIEDDLV